MDFVPMNFESMLSIFFYKKLKSHGDLARVVYMCSSLFQLAPGSCNLSQAEKRITVISS